MAGGSDQQPDNAASDAALWGIALDPEVLAHASDEIEIWEEHLPAVEAFLAVQSQWRMVIGMDRVQHIGLDYSGAQSGLALAGIDPTPELWSAVRKIEAGVVAAANGVAP